MDSFVQLLSMAFALFLLMDPIGNVPIFISVLKDIDPKRHQYIIFRELVIALIIIISFDFLGDLLLEFLNVEQATLLIAGGIILFIIALKMIFPGRRDPDVDISPDKEPFIVPLAIPLVAGPAVLAAVILYSHEQYNEWITIGAIVLAWLASTIILLSASYLKKLLGWRGLVACERLMGLLLILISVQMFLNGLILFLGPHGSFEH
ncbi:MAG: NAAT family transporter [Parachlamydiales bacterium]|nr:NAAT family transporter [Verrucomicrobiota bacterium]MBX3718865.1 NAAT family transporter [Candidatus Acheromyda pituitae]